GLQIDGIRSIGRTAAILSGNSFGLLSNARLTSTRYSMKTSFLAILLALVALLRQVPVQPTPLDAEHCKCSIEVIVRRVVTGEPIPEIELQLRLRNQDVRTIGESVPVYRGGPFSVKTSASGRVEFRDLAE